MIERSGDRGSAEFMLPAGAFIGHSYTVDPVEVVADRRTIFHADKNIAGVRPIDPAQYVGSNVVRHALENRSHSIASISPDTSTASSTSICSRTSAISWFERLPRNV
tara:strand:- start:4817 stop:5137 length:321 start_codon:yes stop_codon:yes gene_type:complete